MFNYLKQARWLATEKFFRLVNGVLITAAVARHLGPDTYGLLALATAYLTIFSAFVQMGADHFNQSELRRTARNQDRFVITALLSRLLMAAMVLPPFLVICLNYISPELALLALLLPINATSIFVHRMFASAQYSRFAINSIASLGVGVILKVLAIKTNASLSYFAFIIVLESFLLLMLNVSINKWNILRNSLNCRTSPFEIKKYIKDCAPLATSAVLIALYFRLETLAVNYWMGPTATGLWAAALMTIVPWIMVANTILPIANNFLNDATDSTADYKNGIIQLIRMMIFLGSIAALVNLAAGYLIIENILGTSYEGVAILIALMSPAIIPLFIGATQDVAIAHRRKTNITLNKALISLPISAVFVTVGASQFGLHGAAVSLVISHTFSALLLNIFLDKQFFALTLAAFRKIRTK